MGPIKPRERILNTATALFTQEGIRAVGVNSIIAEAEVAPMTLYRQFGGKDELVAATLEQWSSQWLQMITEKLERYGDDAEARYSGLWDALGEWFATPEFRGSFIANAAAELRSKPDHPAHRVITSHRKSVRQILEDLSKAAGSIDPHGLASQLLVLMDGAIAIAAVDHVPAAAQNARQLAMAALRVSSL